MQYRFVMFQTQANSPITFPFHISMQAKIIPTSSCSEKSGKTGKNAPSVTGGQRAVTFCAGVGEGGNSEGCLKWGGGGSYGGHYAPLVTLVFLKIEGQNLITWGILMCLLQKWH